LSNGKSRAACPAGGQIPPFDRPGSTLPDVLRDMHGKVAEGIRSTSAALGLAARYGVEMPITEQMQAILHEGKSPNEAIRDLMARPGRDE